MIETDGAVSSRGAVGSAQPLLAFVFDKRRGPIVFVATTVVFALTITALLLIPAAAVCDCANEHTRDPGLVGIVGALIVSPIVENLVAAGIVELMAAHRARAWVIVLTVAVLSGALHAVYGLRAIAGFVGFATQTVSYLIWDDLTFSRRFALTVAQHALFNVPGTLLMVWFGAAS